MPVNWKISVPLLALFLAVASGLSIIGGLTDVDPNEQEVKDALKFAVDSTIAMRNTTFLRKMTRMGKSQKQVAIGMMYVLNAEMATTSCAKGGDEKECAIHEDRRIAFPEVCTFHVWDDPWTKTYELRMIQCAA